ncbi:Beta-xylosidase [Usitatibacter palustris]|uniref:Beta-D-glucoside glucohydrolase n=1 Tax=Usitatibacter palustris TaxID=2732487 RepID=A0A6M4HA21_9PROT|nr:Beta-xylosidase [Usitatibacter palustris]
MSVERRVADLLARMTTEEKIAELHRGIRPLASGSRKSDSRLGIPTLFHESGTPKGGATPFPQGIALAASWDPAGVRDVHAAIARQARTRGATVVSAPSLDVVRDPRRGRIEQTFGEDAFLVTEMGIAALEGLQGMGSVLNADKVIAAAGHFAGHGVPMQGEAISPAPLSRRELRDFFFPPFEQAVQRGGLSIITASRSEIDAVPSHADAWLLRGILRDEWKYNGLVMAAPGGVADLQAPYGVAADPTSAARLAFNAGVDASEGFSALKAGDVDAARLDAAVARVLTLKFKAGLFDKPALRSKAVALDDTVALKAAQRAIVLLKNDGVLPLAQGRVAIVTADRGLAAALRTGARGRVEVTAATKLADAAAQATHIVLVLGDATAKDLDAAMDAAAARGKPIVVVLTGSRPMATVKMASQASAIVGAWSLGAQGGKAIADALLGDINPGGKLPVSIARSDGQLPTYHDWKPSARRGYLFDSTEPLFAFGWGFSYSTFEVSAPRLSAKSMATDGSVEVSVDVRNNGRRAGDEVVQLYVRDTLSTVTRPVQMLRGFERVTLAPGEQRTVRFTLPARSLALWNEQMQRVVEPGEFEVLAGANSLQLQSATLTVLGKP